MTATILPSRSDSHDDDAEPTDVIFARARVYFKPDTVKLDSAHGCRLLLETRQRRAVASEAANKSARALGVAAWSWFELAAAVWTDLAQRLCAARAKCAFVAADEGITFRRKRRATALALLLHLESHTPDITFRRGCHPRLRRASLLTCVTSRRAAVALSQAI